jgi:hypothetical protein
MTDRADPLDDLAEFKPGPTAPSSDAWLRARAAAPWCRRLKSFPPTFS